MVHSISSKFMPKYMPSISTAYPFYCFWTFRTFLGRLNIFYQLVFLLFFDVHIIFCYYAVLLYMFQIISIFITITFFSDGFCRKCIAIIHISGIYSLCFPYYTFAQITKLPKIRFQEFDKNFIVSLNFLLRLFE